jgi:hypothetical protein
MWTVDRLKLLMRGCCCRSPTSSMATIQMAVVLLAMAAKRAALLSWFRERSPPHSRRFQESEREILYAQQDR